jgi:putative cardiolipin synthase
MAAISRVRARSMGNLMGKGRAWSFPQVTVGWHADDTWRRQRLIPADHGAMPGLRGPNARYRCGMTPNINRFRAWCRDKPLLLMFGAVLCAVGFSGCAGGVRDSERPEMTAFPPAQTGRIAERLRPDLEANPGKTGVRLVDSNLDAFAVRIVSARLAVSSLDLQYYIWHDDLTGRLLAAELLRAADRGVRVRVLVDDFDVRGKDPVLRTLDTHPNIEIRVFNPFATSPGVVRTSLEILWRGIRLNRRMHNKAWIADGQLAVVGGRNIGDEYFGAAEERNFDDLDLLLAGPAVGQVTTVFDRYWNSPVAVRIAELARSKGITGGLDGLRENLAAVTREAESSPYVAGLRDSDELSAFLEGRHRKIWTSDVQVIADRPEKIDRSDRDDPTLMLSGLTAFFADAEKQARVLSPYFVPGIEGTQGFGRMVAKGVKVEVVTNSLAATDVAAVHGGYSADRKGLLKAGVVLFELKPSGDPETRRLSPLGSSGASLHTKAATVDGERVFVGSFNLDPRSAWLNCEMGIIVRSPELAAQLDGIIDKLTSPTSSWRVDLDPENKLRWTHEVDGKTEALDRDPEADFERRLLAFLARILPVRGYL